MPSPDQRHRQPRLGICGPNPAYDGPFFFTAEYLLRGVIKVMLSNLDCKCRDAWQPELPRAIKAALQGVEV